MHETMLKFIRFLELEGRTRTAPSYEYALARYDSWLQDNKLNPVTVTVDDLLEYQRWLAESYRKPTDHKPIMKSTQVTWLCAVKSYYSHLYRRGQIIHDPASKVELPKIRKSNVVAQHLNQQEATALIQTQARIVLEKEEGSKTWAAQFRNLAMLSLAIATGRRRESMRNLRVKDLNFERNEVRVEWEKGKPGRVLPCAGWAMIVAKEYVTRARPILCRREDPEWLFVGFQHNHICSEYLGCLVKRVQARCIEDNPDLEELAGKTLSSHSLRVTFATMLFLNGAGIRTVNELLLHRQMSTSARYTPLELDDLRRVCRLSHPRA